MKEKKKDKKFVVDAVGDPAFYNDQINSDKEPIKAVMEKKKNVGSIINVGVVKDCSNIFLIFK